MAHNNVDIDTPPASSVSPMAGDVARPERKSRAKLRVLHIFRYFRPDFTGEGLYLEKMAQHFDRMDIAGDVAVECTRSSEQATGFGRAWFFGLGAGPPRLIRGAMSIWMAANAFRYDLVHFHAFVDRGFVLHMIARLYGCRVIQSCTLDDGLGAVVSGYREMYRPLVRRLCHLIDTVVAISPGLHDDNLTVLPPARCRLIPQGVNLPPAVPDGSRAGARAQWGFADDDVVLLFVGGMCARKDVLFLVRNHPVIATRSGRLRLLLVGPPLEDSYLDSVRQAAAGSPSRDDITIHGYLDDPSPAYAAADVFVFASTAEGFGNVLIEAMAWGQPVVARRLPGVTDRIIEHERTGFLFDTPAQYQAAVTTLAANPALRQAVGDTARQAARDRFDLRVIAARYAALYRRLVADK